MRVWRGDIDKIEDERRPEFLLRQRRYGGNFGEAEEPSEEEDNR